MHVRYVHGNRWVVSDVAPAGVLCAHKGYNEGWVAVCAVQSPLQPLQDDLESTTYETFERDSCKYSQYQAAVESALRDIALDTADQEVIEYSQAFMFD